MPCNFACGNLCKGAFLPVHGDRIIDMTSGPTTGMTSGPRVLRVRTSGMTKAPQSSR